MDKKPKIKSTATFSRGIKPCLFYIFFKFLLIYIITSTYYQNLDHERATVVHLTNLLYPLGNTQCYPFFIDTNISREIHSNEF